MDDWVEHVREWLTTNDRSISWLAGQLGHKRPSYLSRLLNGHQEPPLTLLDAISSIMTRKGGHPEEDDEECYGCPTHPVILTLPDGRHISRTRGS